MEEVFLKCARSVLSKIESGVIDAKSMVSGGLRPDRNEDVAATVSVCVCPAYALWRHRGLWEGRGRGGVSFCSLAVLSHPHMFGCFASPLSDVCFCFNRRTRAAANTCLLLR